MLSVLGGVAILLEEAPEVEFRSGMFYVTDRIGDQTLCRAMRPNAFFLTFTRYANAAKSHKFGSAEIIDFPAIADGVAKA